VTKFEDVARKDFPISRRGYDPAAVDAYLERLEEKLQKESEREKAPMAASISEQVRSILAAAEATAAELRSDAQQAADQMRSTAAAESRQQVTRVSDSSSTLLSELASLRERTQGLLEEIETNSSALKDGLLSLREDVSTFRGQAASDAAPAAAKTQAAGDNFEEARAVLDEARAEALQMARDGKQRDEISRHLDENYELPNREQLVSEVIQKAG
jgi:DivIVA domain-containing protein